MSLEVMIVPTGVANMASVIRAFEQLGASTDFTVSDEFVSAAKCVVLPGVGSFNVFDGFPPHTATAIAKRVLDGLPTLAICLGMQYLCEASDEAPEVPGLGAIPGKLGRFGSDLVVPQMGWNKLNPSPDCRYLLEGHVYYANSYRLETAPEGWRAATSDYGGPFVGGLERGDVLACQFHPELSGELGYEILERWLKGC